MPQKPAQASDLTPAEQAALVALRTPPSTDRWYRNDTEYNTDRARAVVAAVRPVIAAEVLDQVADMIDEDGAVRSAQLRSMARTIRAADMTTESETTR